MIAKVVRPLALALLAAGPGTMASAQGLNDYPPASICGMALDDTASQWDSRTLVAPYVEEARRRGYSIDYCRSVRTPGRESPATAPRRAATEPDALVKSIQGHLAALGFLTGVPDGLLGGRTSTAIMAFQRADKIAVDGQPSEALNERLQVISEIQSHFEVGGYVGCTRTDDGRPVCVNKATGKYKFVPDTVLNGYQQALRAKMAETRPAIPAPHPPPPVPPPPNPPPAAATPAPAPRTPLQKYEAALGPELARRLTNGDAHDVIALLNETTTAPNGMRSPDGRITFRNGKVAVCNNLDANVTGGFIEFVQQDWMSRAGLPATAMYDDVSCPLPSVVDAPVERYDLIVFERGVLAGPKQQVTEAIMELIKLRKLGLYAITPAKPYETAAQAKSDQARENLRRLREGSLPGVGMLMLANSASTIVCALSSENNSAISEFATRASKSITDPAQRIPGDVVVKQASSDDIFAQAKRRQCGFLAGHADFLKRQDEMLARDGLGSTLAPLWMTDQDFKRLER